MVIFTSDNGPESIAYERNLNHGHYIHNTYRNAYAIRHDEWLLIAAETGGISDVPSWFDEERGYVKNEYPGELYNLVNDLGQKHNLYGEKPDKVEELTVLLKEIRTKGQVR